METSTVGKVIVSARIENLFDIEEVFKGQISEDQVRRLEVDDAMVDTGATLVSMPMRLIEQLGLKRIKTAHARTAIGLMPFGIYEQVKWTIQGRDCEVRVMEVADEYAVSIGKMPLALLDFVVNPLGQKLVGNPDHGGDYMIDMY